MEATRTFFPQKNADAVIGALQQAIASGEHWYLALLKAIGSWTDEAEIHEGRIHRYLIAGEAFDLMALAERLCQAVDGLLPENEKEAFLFRGKPPLALTAEEFKRLIGHSKYHQYLNYFYGVTVEEALLQAARDEVRKERACSGFCNHYDEDEPYRRIYELKQAELLAKFRQEKSYSEPESLTLSELKEFTYWLFQYRVKVSEKAKVASDTQKALDWLKRNGYRGKLRLRTEYPGEPWAVLPGK